jgi:hypothetical protein
MMENIVQNGFRNPPWNGPKWNPGAPTPQKGAERYVKGIKVPFHHWVGWLLGSLGWPNVITDSLL